MTDNELFMLDMLKVAYLAEDMGIDISQDYAWELAQEINQDTTIDPADRMRAAARWLREREFIRMTLVAEYWGE